jgi:LysR family transcriptional regulator, transcriptional activator of nhaA
MNFKHLHYFWMAAKTGGILRAGEQLNTTPQTLSGQIKLLEERLGRKLFRKRGRNLELTDEGRIAVGYADEIFSLSAELEAALQTSGKGARTLDFRVGVSDAVPKSVACRLLEPTWTVAEPVRLICVEGKLRDLLAQLSVHQLDLVIADEPMPRALSVKAFNHALGSTSLSFFATADLKSTLNGDFPACLHGAPMLIQGAASPVRARLEQWFIQHGVQPRIVGEFDDGALLKAFAREGRGVFASSFWLEQEICAQYQVVVVGHSAELIEEFFAISAERRISHPCVAAITNSARTQLFQA